MDKRIEDLIEFTKGKYGLDRYYLHNWDLYRSITIFNKTEYILSMEWFPNHLKEWNDEDYSPKGTASIEIDIHSKKTRSVIFVGGVSYAEKIRFDVNEKKEIIRWMGKETGLNYGEQFEIWKEEEREIHFKEYINGFDVSPSGYMECHFDGEGRLTFFSVIGEFHLENLVHEETYTLTLEQVESLAREQLRLIELPNMEEDRIVPAYLIEEIWIKNDGLHTLPFEGLEKSRWEMNTVIEWNQTISPPFQRKKITLTEGVTPDQAFQCEPHPGLDPITDEERQKCMAAIREFLSQEYAKDSGKWIVKSLYRDNGYIQAAIHLVEQKERVFKRKLKVFIDRNTYKAVNYLDNKWLFHEYMDLRESEEIKITYEQAFEKIKPFLELTPCYVYDVEQGGYILCGKLDCHYEVNAHTGNVKPID
ncbi:hypothetical protein [Pradoshia sp.]|uniref:hypothetical protein n=1 Tax=Pradoshia sp. TaxID=2651281 RepID=UPI003F0EB164